MKFRGNQHGTDQLRSLPAWGVWIEIYRKTALQRFPASLPAWGVWIEIYKDRKHYAYWTSRSPHGECGLKFKKYALFYNATTSLPAWGVWIEISLHSRQGIGKPSRSPHGECGLKSCGIDLYTAYPLSLPAWGVWIEIALGVFQSYFVNVAPRMGSVD